MKLTVYNFDRTKSYSISAGYNKNKVYIEDEKGNGKEFRADSLCNKLYEVIDQFFTGHF